MPGADRDAQRFRPLERAGSALAQPPSVSDPASIFHSSAKDGVPVIWAQCWVELAAFYEALLCWSFLLPSDARSPSTAVHNETVFMSWPIYMVMQLVVLRRK
jgi:hypothetical protein